MIFKPDSTKLWDTFIMHHEGTFYLYYLQLRHEAWDGYGLATSADLIHWTDRGTILATEPGTAGMGTGAVWRAGDRWIINYSRGEGRSQRIYFAESDDLLTWRKLPREFVSAPDPRWYECTGDTNSRWDSIWPIPLPDGSFLGVVTASSKDGPPGANGVAGLVSSADGIHWNAEPPASEPCGFGWVEVGCQVSFGPRHYLLVGCAGGARRDPVYNTTGKSGGMFVMVSDSVRGPYRWVEGDPMLLGGRNAPPNWAYIPTYFGRVFRYEGQVLYNHHWMPRANFLDASLGTVKVLKEAAPGKLVLRYWTGNDKLKGSRIFDLRTAKAPTTPTPQLIPSGRWTLACGALRGVSEGSSLCFFPLEPCFGTGVVIELVMTLEGGEYAAGGLLLGVAEQGENKPYEGVACLANLRGLYEFGTVGFGPCGPVFMPENHTLRPIMPGATQHWRVLVRGEFVELYVNDELVQCFGFSRAPHHGIGFFVEQGTIEVNRMEVFRFA